MFEPRSPDVEVRTTPRFPPPPPAEEDASSSSSSVRNRSAFFESIGRDAGDERVPGTVGELIRQTKQERLGAVGPSMEKSSPPEVNVTDDQRIVSAPFEATEEWQLSVRACDVVQLVATPAPDGWTNVALITTDSPAYGARGAVPTSYLVAMKKKQSSSPPEGNAVSIASSSKSQQKQKKYKPVAKNLVGLPTPKKSWF